MRTLLKSGVSVIALSLVTSGAALAADETFTTDQDAMATVSGATSAQTNTTNLNDITANTGENFTGIMSALQNNGANSVVNNGNAVSAIVNAGTPTSNESFGVGDDNDAATQTASVNGTTSTEDDVDDDNIIDGSAFQSATGIVSAAQNNGANSAINNGNAVSAVVESGNSTQTDQGSKSFVVRAANSATVEGGVDGGTSSRSDGTSQNASTNHNRLAETAFENFTGIASVAQNNGANSAINNGNAVAGMVETGSVAGGLTFNVILDQDATVKGNVASEEDDFNSSPANPAGNIDHNLVTDDAFQEAEGIVSVAQNNGANSAINNGNGVSGIVNSGQVVNAEGVLFNSVGIENNQTALVGGAGALIRDIENDDSPNTNLINDNAFQNFEGVASVAQNNGPNSAINNGNSVSAIVLDGNAINSGSTVLDSDSTQSASVNAGGGSITANVFLSQTDNNTLIGNAFQRFSGVSSTVQNNGSNAAINNGNTVAAFLGEENSANAADLNTLAADQNTQTASVSSGTQGGTVSNIESSDSHDTNLISGNTFNTAEGVHSVAQNNGANAAINNGNSVAAIIVDGSIVDGATSLVVSQSQSAEVLANLGEVTNSENDVNDTNTASGTTFQSADGVASVFQNNGANSAINNGNTVALLLSDDSNIDVDASSFDGSLGGISQSAMVDSSSPVSSIEAAASIDTNLITDQAFQSSEGVYSVGQNNGPNSAINNGNTVAAAVADEGAVDASGGAMLNTSATQTATVGVTGAVTSQETGGSHDTNTINTDAFQNAAGVISVVQNNGPNSAINNGNSVAAIIGDCPQCSGANTFTTASVSTGMVGAGASAINTDVNNTNRLIDNAFQNTRGIVSVTQNNGANAALSNGNVVSAIVDPS